MKLKNALKTLCTKAKSPKALMVYGVIGIFATGVLSAIGTWKAKDIYEKSKEEPSNPLDTGVEMAKCYIPAVAAAATASYCVIKSGATYEKVLSNTIKTFRQINTVQNAQFEQIKGAATGAIASKMADKPSTDEIIFIESYSHNGDDRVFRSTMEKVLQAEIELNRIFFEYGCVSLNYYYALLGLPPVAPFGYNCGWTWDGAMEYGYSSINIELIDCGIEDGLVCKRIIFDTPPHAPLIDEDPDEFLYS